MKISRVAALAMVAMLPFGSAVADTVVGSNYVVEITAPAGPAGAPTSARVTIRPSGAWKLNDEYPFRVDIAGAGVKPTRARLDEDDVALAGHRVDFAVGYTATGAGALDLILHFGTCDGRSCASHKQAVHIPIAVK